jgi:uncharacterized protein (TIGR02588 family)
MGAAHEKRPHACKRDAETPLLEWLIGGIGVALLVSCVAFLVYQGLTDAERPGPITSIVTDVIAAGDRHVVRFEIRNGGSQTLSNLHLSAHLLEDGREIESARMVIDYLPGHSSREGGFYFRRDPRSFTVEIRPEGYQRP